MHEPFGVWRPPQRTPECPWPAQSPGCGSLVEVTPVVYRIGGSAATPSVSFPSRMLFMSLGICLPPVGRLIALLVGACIVQAPNAAPGVETRQIVVYGATSGGIVAAIQAKKLGKTVIVIEPSRHPGGLTSGGLGATDIGNKAAIGGLSREFYQRIGRHYAKDSAWTREPPRGLRQATQKRSRTRAGDVDVRAARRRAGVSRLAGRGGRRGGVW